MSRRNNRLITSLAIVLSSTLLAQAPDTLWTKTYGSTGDAILFSIDQTADGGFIMSGSLRFSPIAAISGWSGRRPTAIPSGPGPMANRIRITSANQVS